VAIWQYDFLAIPRDELSAVVGGVPVALTAEQINELCPWQNSQPYPHFEVAFGEWRPEMESWSTGLRMWGNEDSNRIDVSYKNELVTAIEFRVELRSLNIHFIEVIADFARKSNCLLLSLHSLVLIDPLRQNILLHLCRSPGANRVLDLLGNSSTTVSLSGYPRVFLSHSSADKPFVGRLAADLKSRGVSVWFDQWELKVGDSLTQKIEDGINESGWLVVVLSKKSVVSDWVQKELRAAQARELRDKDVFVLPIIIDDCAIPLFLLDKIYADFRHSYAHGLEYLLKRVVEGQQ
jgi:hypothetical protein